MAPAAELKGVKGLVLAAGLGTRLRPLTDRWPKPLIPFAGTNGLDLALKRFHEAGIQDVAVNAHYMADVVSKAVDRNPFGQRLSLSFEPEILGTGGCYNPLRDWLGDNDLVVLNGDVLSMIDLKGLVHAHRAAKAVATMALLGDVIPGESAVFHEANRIRAIGKTGPAGAKPGNFACAQVLTTTLLDLLPEDGSFDVISKGYQPALAKGMKVAASHYEGFWHDLRTPAFYAAAVFDYLKLLGVETWIHPSTKIDASVQLGPKVSVDDDVVIGRGAKIANAILLPGARVSAGARLDGVIVGPDLLIQV